MPITIVIVDDHPLAIGGMKNMLQDDEDFKVVATYENGAELLAGLSTQTPDVLLLDVQLPDINGVVLAKTVSEKYPTINTLAITSYDTPALVKAMLRNGCKGYILKNTRVNDLKQAIETVASGELFLTPALKDQMLHNMLHSPKKISSNEPLLTKREKQILQLIVEENTSQEIADKLFLSLRTVENHRNSLLHKLQAKNVAGLVRAAIERGLVNV